MTTGSKGACGPTGLTALEQPAATQGRASLIPPCDFEVFYLLSLFIIFAVLKHIIKNLLLFC